MDELRTQWNQTDQDFAAVLKAAGGLDRELAGWIGGFDGISAFQSDRDKLYNQYSDALLRGDESMVREYIKQFRQLADSASQSLLGKPLYSLAPMGMVSPGANNTLSGNLAEQAGKVGEAIGEAGKAAAWGGGAVLALVVVVGAIYLTAKWSR